MRRLVLLAAVALWALGLSACSDSSSPPAEGSLASIVGHWSLASGELPLAFDELLIRVEERDGAHYVSVDGGPLERADVADGRLVLPVLGSGSRNLAFGMDGERAAVFAWVSHGKNPEPGEPTGFFWAPYAVEALTPAAYEKKTAARADERMRGELLGLDMALRAWTDRHGQPPAADEVAEDGAFGRWLTSGSAGFQVPWPTSPYTWEPMHAGDEPGDFRYARRGGGYTLIGRLHDGTIYTTAEEPPR